MEKPACGTTIYRLGVEVEELEAVVSVGVDSLVGGGGGGGSGGDPPAEFVLLVIPV